MKEALCLCLTLGALTAQPERQAISFLRQFGTPSGDAVYDIVAGSSGSLYLAGATEGTLPGQTSAGALDAFVRRSDAEGKEIWTRQFGTPRSDTASAIVVHSTGVYVTGSTSGAFPGQSQQNLEDTFLRKYDASGNVLWTRQFGAPSGVQTVPYGLAADRQSLYILGWTNGQFPNAGGFIFVRKYDTSGNELWTRQFEISYLAGGEGIAADDTGIYIVGSTVTRYDEFNPQVNGFVRKLDSNGNELWTRIFDSLTNYSDASGVTTHSSGIYVIGDLNGLFVRKYDRDGNELWTNRFVAPGPIWGKALSSVSSDSSGVYVAGTAYDLFDDVSKRSNRDVFLLKCDSAGNALWTSHFFLPFGWYDAGVSVTTGEIGVYLAGGGTRLDRVSGVPTDDDAFLARVERTTGTPVATVLSRNAAFTSPRAIATDGSSLFVVNGPANSTNHNLFSMPLNGGPVTSLYGALRNPLSVTVLENSLFWIDPDAGPANDTQILTGPVDGSRQYRAIYTGSLSGDAITDGSGVTTDGSSLFTVDQFNGRVHRMHPNGSGLQLLASRWTGGVASERLQQIVESAGALYIADAGRMGVAEPGVFSLPKTGGTFRPLYVGAPLVCPSAIAARDANSPGTHQVFVADPCAKTLWTMPRAGGTPVALLSGSQFGAIHGLAFHNDVLYATRSAGAGVAAGSGVIYRIVPRVCDTDWDGDVDRSDTAQIFAARNTAAARPGDPWDMDGDGWITTEDARKCTLLCTRPNCAE